MNIGNRMSQHAQSLIPSVKTARSQFDRSHTKKMTFDFDFLVPVLVQEVIPGDVMNLQLHTFARLATQKVPIMDNMMLDYFFFFCPNRLTWDKWERFMGDRTNPDSSIDFICPQMTFPTGGPEVGTIYDQVGLPTDITGGYTIKNCLPFRAYNLIWNEWFRDENLQSRVDVPIDDGPDVPGDYQLLKRGKRHDYFASCLPWPQKGDAVDLPLAGSAPVISTGVSPTFRELLGATNHTLYGKGSTNALAIDGTALSGDQFLKFGSVTGLEADLTNASAATINQLRQAFSIQSLLELDARGGTRYVEILLSHYNVVSPDFRLQRPEYLGGGQARISTHPVAQTSPTDGSDPQAQLAAYGTSANMGGIGFTKSFVEHGYVIGLACARADITYQQGIERMWDRSTRYDFFWPKLQELGEQAVLNREIFVSGNATNDNLVFGYQERFAEYRYQPSLITGEFRSTYATSLDFWHMAQEFDSQPGLDATFIQQNTPIERAIAVTNAPHLLWDGWFQLKHARGMMTYSVPSTLGRF